MDYFKLYGLLYLSASVWKILNDQFAGTNAHAVQQFRELRYKTSKNFPSVLINTDVNANPSFFVDLFCDWHGNKRQRLASVLQFWKS